jgi:REP element-mobilizing transposase RayT
MKPNQWSVADEVTASLTHRVGADILTRSVSEVRRSDVSASARRAMHDDPIGYFLTWATYGTWLPGDARGWVEYRHGWQLPDPIRELEAKARMTEDACILTPAQRRAVAAQIADTCAHRGWMLHAVNCRSNHVHVVVSAEVAIPKKIRGDLKAWATRTLKEKFDAGRENWWAERGSIRYLNTDDDLQSAILYVRESQDADRYKH